MSGIEAARRVPIEEVLTRRGIKLNGTKRWLEGPCPNCLGTDRFSVNTDRQLFNCRNCGGKGKTAGKGDVIDLVKFLDGCDTAAAIATLLGEGGPSAPSRTPVQRHRSDEDEATKRLALARWLWGRRKPIAGTPAETYLRRARGISGPLPATLGYLEPSAKYPDPTLIAAFGLATEIDMAEHEARWRAELGLPLHTPNFGDPVAIPGVQPVAERPTLHISKRAVAGVHLIKLLPGGSDGRRNIKDAKITIGVGFVAPIVLAAPNDALALIIGEGIEKVLAAHQVTGAGAWAATSAVRLPGLADLVPSYIETVTILVDDNDAGRRNSLELAAKLDGRRIDVRMTLTGEAS